MANGHLTPERAAGLEDGVPTNICRPELLAMLKTHDFTLINNRHDVHVKYQHSKYPDITGGFAAHGNRTILRAYVSQAGKLCLKALRRDAEKTQPILANEVPPSPPLPAYYDTLPEWARIVVEQDGELVLRHAIYPELGVRLGRNLAAKAFAAQLIALQDLETEYQEKLQNLQRSYGIEVATGEGQTRLIQKMDGLNLSVPPYDGAEANCLTEVQEILQLAEDLAEDCQLRKERYLRIMELSIRHPREKVGERDGKTQWEIHGVPLSDDAIRSAGKQRGQRKKEVNNVLSIAETESHDLIPGEAFTLSFESDSATNRILISMPEIALLEQEFAVILHVLGSDRGAWIKQNCERGGGTGNRTTLTARGYGTTTTVRHTPDGETAATTQDTDNALSIILLMLTERNLAEHDQKINDLIQRSGANKKEDGETLTLTHPELSNTEAFTATAPVKPGVRSSPERVEAKEALLRRLLKTLLKQKDETFTFDDAPGLAPMEAAVERLETISAKHEIETQEGGIEAKLVRLMQNYGFMREEGKYAVTYRLPGERDTGIKPVTVAQPLGDKTRGFVMRELNERLAALKQRVGRIDQALQRCKNAGMTVRKEDGHLTITPAEGGNPVFSRPVYGTCGILTKPDVVALEKIGAATHAEKHRTQKSAVQTAL